MSLKLASGSYDNKIKFWDPSRCECKDAQTIDLKKFNAVPTRLQINHNKSKLAVGMMNCLKIYDLNKVDTIYRSIDCCKGNVTSVGFFRFNQSQSIFMSSEDGYIKIFDLNTKKQVLTFKNGKPISCAVLTPNQNQILSGDDEGNLKFWDIKQSKSPVIEKTSEQNKGIRSVAISYSGKTIIYGDNDGKIHSYYNNGVIFKQCKNLQQLSHDEYILKVQISPNNKYLATCSADKTIKLATIKQNESGLQLTPYTTFKGHFKWVWDCQFSCDSAYLISCSTDQTIKLWSVEKAELVQTLKGHQKGVICIALNDVAES